MVQIVVFYLDDERMVQIVVEQGQDLQNPPMTVHALLDILAKQAPAFAALVRSRLSSAQN